MNKDLLDNAVLSQVVRSCDKLLEFRRKNFTLKINNIPADAEVFKTSSGRLRKVTMSYD